MPAGFDYVSPSGSSGVLPTTAVGDGKYGKTGVTTAGDATFTDAAAVFTSADIGKTIVINQAGHASSGLSVTTTVASINSATSIELATNALRSLTDVYYCYGTDDTAAITADIASALAIAQDENAGRATVQFEAKTYMVAGALLTTDGYNTQIKVPWISAASGEQKVAIELRGAGDHAMTTAYTETGAPQPDTAGTILFSSLSSPPAFSASVGAASMIGGPAYGKTSQVFTNVHMVVRGITARGPHFPGCVSFDLSYCLQATVENVKVDTNEPYTSISEAGHTQSIGIIMPQSLNNAISRIDAVVIGRYYGLIPGEHLRGTYLAYRCDVALGVVGMTHAAHFDYLDTEICKYHMAGVNITTGVVAINGGNIVADLWDIEDASSGLFQTTYHVNDPDSYLRLDAKFARFKVGVTEGGLVVPAGGGKGMRCIDLRRGTGAPRSGAGAGSADTLAVPASTVNQRNTYWRDSAVTVVGGTVTAITVDGAATGLTEGTVIVPSGKNINITYSVAPTWVWTLL